ncbi:hypothetical protein [Chitinophaga sp.]
MKPSVFKHLSPEGALTFANADPGATWSGDRRHQDIDYKICPPKAPSR